MSRDVAFVMQFRDRERRRVRVAESRGYTREMTYVYDRTYIRHFYVRAYIHAYIDRRFSKRV